MTNNYNLPKALVRAISKDTHRAGGTLSTTQLLKSPREFWLTARHEFEEDAISKMWAVFGSASHAVAERGENEQSLVEEYFKIELNGITLTGMLDLFEDGVLWDYKTVSVWSLLLLDHQKSAQFIGQLNTYAYALSKAGMHVRALKILMIMRDWQASKAKFDTSYPDFQVQVVEVPLFNEEQQLSYILKRIDRLMQFKDTPDDELPLCSEAYRWVKPSKFAVMKGTNKKATKLCDTLEEAELYASDIPQSRVEERKADLFKRCEYCSAREFCSQTEYTENDWRREHKDIKVQMSYDEFIKETEQW